MNDKLQIKSGPFGTVLEFDNSAKKFGLPNGLGQEYFTNPLGSGVAVASYRSAILNILNGYKNSGVDIFDTPTFRLGSTVGRSESITEKAIVYINEITKKFRSILGKDKFLLGDHGPFGDCYTGEGEIRDIKKAIKIYSKQIEASVRGGVDALLGETFTGVESAIGFARKANEIGVPIYLSFFVDKDGDIPGNFNTNEKNKYGDIIREINNKVKVTGFGINCSSQDSILKVLADTEEIDSRLIKIVYPNASSNHGDYTVKDTDHCCHKNGGVDSLIRFSKQAIEINPNIKIIGGCCGFEPDDYENFSEIIKSI